MRAIDRSEAAGPDSELARMDTLVSLSPNDKRTEESSDAKIMSVAVLAARGSKEVRVFFFFGSNLLCSRDSTH
jgi:hypothetical protein